MQQWSTDKTRLERNHWRDAQMSDRHRSWGFNCPCTDIDFLLVEYHIAKPVALIEYKHYKADFPNLAQASYRALEALADKAQLPLLLTFYWPDIWAFRVYALNTFAMHYFSEQEDLTESEYVARLHRMRRLVLSKEMSLQLKTIKPP